jgi:hypothetical protein
MQKFRVTGKLNGRDIELVVEGWYELGRLLKSAEKYIYDSPAITIEVING